ncbi:double-strand break repair protein AddB [Alphaproteobacteria bacterium GH1-50]|uniref:Double-strand break repair protein AddB n=1 Tax=Kangsaoukella pontilimi TaxID=2691042 RepID=A0A7C9IPN4_9RHOB|nr:double-strand break repair protein AddB [Kangsaoukella pontilimi]MXQ08230.1 double-strand break repair protein AddB [Kangsaoukella pontilimi]
MFDPTDTPRVFGVPPGADFPDAVVTGILDRMSGQPPEALARVTVLVNTRRMQRRLRELFSRDTARLLPRIRLVTDIAELVPTAPLPRPTSALARRLELARLIAALLDQDPTLAPRAALFDLADSLAALLDEMQVEGVPPDRLRNIRTGDGSGHWARTQTFLGVVTDYLAATDDGQANPEAINRAALDILLDGWSQDPPDGPVIVAGSTGSRGTTFRLMQAVASLPQGALILPGFDDHLPSEIWSLLTDGNGVEDHPQYRFALLLKALGVAPGQVSPWPSAVPDPARNALVSLSLRPAPVTDQWLSEGPALGDLIPATSRMTLIEAPGQRAEATAISVAIRDAVERGETVALITPDRVLGRRVAASLARWDIQPDDSAGQPLNQTAPGRFLRQAVRLIGAEVTSEALVAMLKHPLVRSGDADRGPHLLHTRDFELLLRRRGTHLPGQADLDAFTDAKPERSEWADWIARVLDIARVVPDPSLGLMVDAHLRLAELIADGGTGGGTLWREQAGRDISVLMDRFRETGASGAPMPLPDYIRLFDRALAAENMRNPDTVRRDVMIWGTLEARVQGASLVILGGLNDGSWPGTPSADPWLNRAMRREAGLLLPERQIGLSAHDYQQAVAAETVILSRSLRDAEAQTVPSRWLNRFTNLLRGLPNQNGQAALDAMKDRGKRYLDIAQGLETPVEPEQPAPRPAPAPPVSVRPRTLSVTEIETLIRDPYAIYAKHVLRVKPLDPLRPRPDMALRGIVYHEIMDRALAFGPFEDAKSLEQCLISKAREVLGETVPWPSARVQWGAHFEAIAPGFSEREIVRQVRAQRIWREQWGEIPLGNGYTIKGKADRIDLLKDGRLAIFDYKAGGPPSAKRMRYFQRQLLIEAVMAKAGGFKDIDPAEVAFVSHLGLDRKHGEDMHELVAGDELDFRTVTISAELSQLVTAFDNPDKGYPSRRAMEELAWDGDYDHLARYGEWDDTKPATKVLLP